MEKTKTLRQTRQIALYCHTQDRIVTHLPSVSNPLRREPWIRLKPPDNKRFCCSFHCFSCWIQSQWKREGRRSGKQQQQERTKSKESLGSVHWPFPPFPFFLDILLLLILSFFLVVPELRMDHYVISRQAFNCFRDERAALAAGMSARLKFGSSLCLWALARSGKC